jgi:MoaA/NifB/PqqE/SkfB family radical SAM enzyme
MKNLYSELKAFHFREKLAELARRDVTPPVHIRLKPINACNHACFFCCYRMDELYVSQRFHTKDMIPQRKMREVVRDLGNANVRAVTFTGGGEPLIYPFIVETLEGLLNRGIKVAALTNGARLEGEVGEVLAAGASWLRVSIDAADGETLAKSRRVKPGEFDHIVGNIRRFAEKKHRDCELGINFIVTRMNASRTYDFIKLMKECGADHVKISGCVVSTKAAENNAYHAEHAELVKGEMSRARAELEDDGFHVVDRFHGCDDNYDKKYTWCPFIHYLNVIAADQVVYACQDKAYTDSGVLGSIREQSLCELWESKEYGQRLAALDPSIQCNHHCVQHGKNVALLNYLTTDQKHLEFV